MDKSTISNNAVFISYRRDGGDVMAQLLHDHLIKMGYNVFYDIVSIRSGNFLKKLDNEIERCIDFVLILPKDGLARCQDKDDIVRREIRLALNLKKNIVPIMMRDFEFPNNIPADISEIKFTNGISMDNMNFLNAKIDKLVSMLHSKPDKKPPLLSKIVNKKSICIVSAVIGSCLLACALAYMMPRNVENMNYSIVDTDICSIKYTGHIFAGKPDGTGELSVTWEDGTGSKFIGSFSGGYPNGSGTYYWNNGEGHTADDWSWITTDFTSDSDYIGLTHFDQYYGIGFTKTDDGEICFGEWKDNYKYGYNEDYVNGKRISGCFKYEDLLQLDDGKIKAYQGYTVNGEIDYFGTIWYDDPSLTSFNGIHDKGTPIFGVCTWNNGCTYKGLFDINGNPGNQGIFTYSNGDTIESINWKYDSVADTLLVSNDGTLSRPHRDPGYIGMLIDDKCVGYGSGKIDFVSFLPTRYEGEYRDGIPDGNGKIEFNEESWYVGQVSFQGRDFMWDYYQSDSINYTSFMQEFGPNGDGRFRYYNGERLIGNWSTLQDFDGGYRGMIYNNQHNGIGSMKYGDNSLYYVGEWRNDLPNGFGSFYYVQDSVEKPIIDKIWSWETRLVDDGTYTGLICDDKINGYGTYTCDLYTYEGGWKNGKPCGYGRKTSSDGEVEEGIWKDGELE